MCSCLGCGFPAVDRDLLLMYGLCKLQQWLSPPCSDATSGLRCLCVSQTSSQVGLKNLLGSAWGRHWGAHTHTHTHTHKTSRSYSFQSTLSPCFRYKQACMCASQAEALQSAKRAYIPYVGLQGWGTPYVT